MAEILNMWRGYRWRLSVEGDRYATLVLWLRSMMDDKVEYEAIRKSFGWMDEDN